MTDPVIIGNARPTTRIYMFCEWPSMEPRYVGKTSRYLIDRRKGHLWAARRGNLPVNRWLRKKREMDGSFATVLLEFVAPGQDWAERERYWIQKFNNEGARLLNLTDGGEGLAGHAFTSEHKAKIAKALRSGGTFACEVCGKEFYRKRNEIAKGHNRFCSKRCSNTRHKGAPLL